MLITVIQTSAAAAQTLLVLCDGATRDQDKSSGPEDLRYAGDQTEQIAPLLRGTTPAVFDRGNGVDRFTFGVTRRCASPDAADAWFLTHRLSIPRNTDPAAPVTVEFRTGSAAIVLQNPVIKINDAAPKGCSVIVKYTIIGGPLVSAAPGAPQ